MFVNGADIKAGRDERSQRTSDTDDSLKESEAMVNQNLAQCNDCQLARQHTFIPSSFRSLNYYLLTYEEVWHQSQGETKEKEAKSPVKEV